MLAALIIVNDETNKNCPNKKTLHKVTYLIEG